MGTLKSELLINEKDNTCLAFYSPEIIKIINKSRETAFDIGADATFQFLPKRLFKNGSRKKTVFHHQDKLQNKS